MNIPIHQTPIDIEDRLKHTKDLIKISINGLLSNYTYANHVSFMENIEDYLVFAHLGQETVKYQEIIACFQMLFQINIAYLETKEKPTGDTIIFRFGNYQSKTISDPTKKNSGFWLKTFHYALISRARQVIEYLQENPPSEEETRKDNTFYDEHYVHYIKFLQTLGKNPQHSLEYIQDALAALEHWPEFLARRRWLALKMWIPVLENKVDHFNESLMSALLGHQDYYDSDNIDDFGISYRKDKSGLFNLLTTIISSYAFDQGITIDITSDYMPQFILEGKVNVDIDTPLDFYWEKKSVSLDDLFGDLYED